MKHQRLWIRAGIGLICILFLVSAVAADRPARQNGRYRPEAADQFPFVTTGVVVKIKSATIASDGTITARFTMTDPNGAGLDINGVWTPGPVAVAFVAAYIPQGQTQYTAYTTTVNKSHTNNNPPQTQAGTDSGGKFTLVDALTGTYDYTFGTKLPAGYDVTATHSVGMQAERDLTAFGFQTNFASDSVYTWVPNGSPVTVTRDVVNEASCNGCHDPLSAHGGGRHGMDYCVLCHTPQSINPDTENTVDMKVFIHKLHMGSSLPSVQAGTPYTIFHRGNLQDYSTIVFPQDIRNCTVCHAAGPKQADNWKLNPSRAVCGSCHDDVDWTTGVNHSGLPELDDNACKSCHVSSTPKEFDASIQGAHVIPNYSTSLPGLVTQVLKVDNTTPGSAPTVTFQVNDKAGNPVDISQITQMRVVLGGPNVDYQTGPGGIRVAEDASKTPGSNGVYAYTLTNKIPAAAAGSYTISLEARNTVTVGGGTPRQTNATDAADPVENYFSVDKSAVVPRRQVVSTAACSTCHSDLTFVHGGYLNQTQACTMCHNPALTDGTSKQSVNMAWQIHSIHRGDALTNPYILGTTNYQDVRFPGDLRVCTTCHLANTYQVDNIGAKAMVASPGGFTATTPPISAACQGCHDDIATASHALVNTTTLGESCVVCHGMNAEFAVDKVHAR